jgi:hypothetical protein
MLIIDENGDYQRLVVGVELVKIADCDNLDGGSNYTEAITVHSFENGKGYSTFTSHNYHVDDHVEDYGEEVAGDVQSDCGLGRRTTGRRVKGEG